MKGAPEAQRLFEESQYSQNQRSFPLNDSDDDLLGGAKSAKPVKDHRVTFTIGAFNDGLKTNFCKIPEKKVENVQASKDY